MKPQTMLYVALALTVLYGAGFGFIRSSHLTVWALVGAVVCAAGWTLYGLATHRDQGSLD